VIRNDVSNAPLLNALQSIEASFAGPTNPESELAIGFISIRIPAFPIIAVREAVMNALVHRDYSNAGEILIRHAPLELVVTSPGGFIGGITTRNILRHEPIARNRTLANAFMKLRLVESAGVGRSRIFESLLRFGKRPPRYTSDGDQVTLTIFDGTYDKKMAALVAEWQREGRNIDLDGLLVLMYLREQRFIDSGSACDLLQLSRDTALSVLDRLAGPRGILERRGETRTATYHLNKEVSGALVGKAAYTRARGIDKARYAEIVRQFVKDHGSATPSEIRELLGLGDSKSARVEVSRMLREWSGPGGFLGVEGTFPRHRYVGRYP
jgi:ATP-dependent DNA helicase RecG